MNGHAAQLASGIGSTSRRAMTMVEIVLAVVMLAMVTASIFGALGAMERMHRHNMERLGAFELANRMILQWLDDKKQMPPKGLPLEYGRFKYLCDYGEERVTQVLNPRQAASTGSTPQGLDRFKQFTVTIWSTEEGVDYPIRGEVIAELTRMYDPFAPRNPDEMARRFRDPEDIAALLRELTGGGDVTLPTGGGNRNGGGGGNK
jgi:hypothetical protein